MLVALADTHASGSPELHPHLRETIQTADIVCHAGDFTTVEALETFESLADRLVAVSGNSDGPVVRNRLPDTATVDYLGRRILVVHGHDHDRTSLSLLARQEQADIVLLGHTHRPAIENGDQRVQINPGSHADPRGSRPAFLVVTQADSRVKGRLVALGGDPVERVWL